MAPATRLLKRLVFRLFAIATLLLIVFNEHLIYSINRLSWQQIDCKTENCTRIVFIADPQLLGRMFDKSLYRTLARLDSDRYLRKTFETAVDFVRPHIVCFLGDLLDEGSVASAEDFHSYVERFKSIYNDNIDEQIAQVHVPGDNDIGGENGEYISNTNQRRFEFEFMREDIFDYAKRYRFFKINRMLLDFENPDKANNPQRVRVALSHAPLLIGGGPLLRSVLNDIDPHVLFTAHWHESRIFVYPSTKVLNFYENEVRHFDLRALKETEHSYLEIMVPTTSYRMGKQMIGIGYGVLENYNLSYTVLWLPNRIVFLLMYAFWVLFCLCSFVVFKMMTSCPCRSNQRRSKMLHSYL